LVAFFVTNVIARDSRMPRRDALLPFAPGGLAAPDGYHPYPKICLMSSNNLHEHVCYISVFTEIDHWNPRAVVSM
jgi:hypothetical protein